jgi:hypothetical protein
MGSRETQYEMSSGVSMSGIFREAVFRQIIEDICRPMTRSLLLNYLSEPASGTPATAQSIQPTQTASNITINISSSITVNIHCQQPPPASETSSQGAPGAA